MLRQCARPSLCTRRVSSISNTVRATYRLARPPSPARPPPLWMGRGRVAVSYLSHVRRLPQRTLMHPSPLLVDITTRLSHLETQSQIIVRLMKRERGAEAGARRREPFIPHAFISIHDCNHCPNLVGRFVTFRIGIICDRARSSTHWVT